MVTTAQHVFEWTLLKHVKIKRFFQYILLVSVGLGSLNLSKMSTIDAAEIEAQMDQENDGDMSQAKAPAAKKRRVSSGKPRAEARPYKKYDLLNLEGKITKMRKQIDLQRSRLLLLEDKLEKHEKEIAIRAQETV